LKVLIDEWYNKDDFESKTLVLNAIKVLLTERPELIKILSEDKNAKRILDELKF